MNDRSRQFVKAGAITLGYWLLFWTLDSQATFFEVAPGVSLWYPSAGLSLALLVAFGLAYVPAVFVASMFSGLVIAEPSIPVQHLILPNLLIAFGNAGAAAWLRYRLGAESLLSPRGVRHLVLVAFVLPACISVLSVLSYMLTGLAGYSAESFTSITFSWWLGDAAGILTVTPALLVGIASLPAFRSEIRAVWSGGSRGSAWRSLVEFALECGLILLALYLAFYTHDETSYQLYMCFLPLLWIAFRHGLPRSTLGVLFINAGAVVALRGNHSVTSILDLQLFVIALALTGLFLGALVSERKRVLEALQRAHSELEQRLASRRVDKRDPTPSSRPSTSTSEAGAPLQRYIEALQANVELLEEEASDLLSRNKELATSEQQWKQVNARKNQLLSVISHDLRNLIGSSTGFAELLASEAKTLPRSNIEEFAGHLNSAIRHMNELLENFLAWAKMNVGHQELRRERHRVRELLDLTVSLYSVAAAKKSVRLEWEAEEDLEVVGSRIMLSSVLQNLLANAVKFSHAGGRVVAGARRVARGVEFFVRDFGVGMSRKQLAQVLDSGTPYSTIGTAGEEGTGLGLVLSKEMVEQHGGRLWAESEPGRGSTFYFFIPDTRVDPDAASRHAASSTPTSGGV